VAGLSVLTVDRLAELIAAAALAGAGRRAQIGRVQVRSELSFGIREHAAVRVRLAGGREIWFRGSADRVDRAGNVLVVVDDKTGSPQGFQDGHSHEGQRTVLFDFEGSGTENPPGAAFCPACSISWDGTRQPAGA